MDSTPPSHRDWPQDSPPRHHEPTYTEPQRYLPETADHHHPDLTIGQSAA